MIVNQHRPIWSCVLFSIIHTMIIADTVCNQLCRLLLTICIYYITWYFVLYITWYIMWCITIWYNYAYDCVSLTIIHPTYCVTACIRPISFIPRIVLLHILGLCMLIFGWGVLSWFIYPTYCSPPCMCIIYLWMILFLGCISHHLFVIIC